MKVLGIDQSISMSGIVVLENDYPIYFCLIKTKKDKFRDKFARMNYISRKIREIVKLYGIKEIKIEGLPFGNMPGNATRDLAGLQAVIVCDLNKIGLIPKIITPKSAKLFATGKGNAKKEDMRDALPESILKLFIDSGAKKTTGLYDLSDAYWIARYKKD